MKGAIAGVLSGAVMAFIAMISSWVVGLGFFFPLQLVSAVFLGVKAILGGVPALFLGVAIHLLVSAAWGMLFSARGAPPSGVGPDLVINLVLCLVYGCAIWAVMTFAVLPIFNPTLAERVALTPMNWFLQHLAFGGTLGVTSRLLRRPTRTAHPDVSSSSHAEPRRAA